VHRPFGDHGVIFLADHDVNLLHVITFRTHIPHRPFNLGRDLTCTKLISLSLAYSIFTCTCYPMDEDVVHVGHHGGEASPAWRQRRGGRRLGRLRSGSLRSAREVVRGR
jgi:hypothetical protein